MICYETIFNSDKWRKKLCRKRLSSNGHTNWSNRELKICLKVNVIVVEVLLSFPLSLLTRPNRRWDWLKSIEVRWLAIDCTQREEKKKLPKKSFRVRRQPMPSMTQRTAFINLWIERQMERNVDKKEEKCERRKSISHVRWKKKAEEDWSEMCQERKFLC